MEPWGEYESPQPSPRQLFINASKSLQRTSSDANANNLANFRFAQIDANDVRPEIFTDAAHSRNA